MSTPETTNQVAAGMTGSASRSFTYDGFGRISGSSTNGVLTSSYGYRTVMKNTKRKNHPSEP